MTKVAMCGTFDVENYGDLLFPLLARHELAKRIDPLALQCFSYYERSADAWPFEVTSLAQFSNRVAELQGLIIGGGHIIRFDKNIAPGYFPPDATLHHPLSIWLTPALLALEHGVPVMWNAPAVYGPVPDWAAAMVAAVVDASAYVSVRDAASQRELSALVPHKDIALVPDSVFGIAALIDPHKPSAAFSALRAKAGLRRPYVVVQSVSGVEPALRALLSNGAAPVAFQILALSMGPVLGDADEIVEACMPEAIRLDEWPNDPLLIAELIAGAEAVIGPSLHLAITALACGVPVFRPEHRDDGKYELLRRFEGAGMHTVTGTAASPEWFRARFGRGPVVADAAAARVALTLHWDRIAQALAQAPGRDLSRPMRALWQQLPTDLERGAKLSAKLGEAQRSIAALQAETTALRRSLSWRVTAPLRGVLGALRGNSNATQDAFPVADSSTSPAAPVLRLRSIERAALESAPYAWARVDRLFSAEHGAALVATFPRDAFKVVQGYDGEKDYAYRARALIGMGSATISNAERLSPAWRRLATDLLAPAYRDALGRLTGIDLSSMRMEANAFHYGPGAWLGPHVDLADKIVTHVLYFNGEWDPADGGCLQILRSSQMHDSACIIAPIVGSSAVLVRSDRSWHAVSQVDPLCTRSRRSVTVTFYRDDAVSTMWPPGDDAPTSDYVESS